MNHGGAICGGSNGAKNAFAAGLNPVSPVRGDYCGILFMLSLLLAVYEADIEVVDTLRLGDVN